MQALAAIDLVMTSISNLQFNLQFNLQSAI
jgi:hypothetical protein